MIADIRHSKLNTDIGILHSKSAPLRECEQKNGHKSERKSVTKNQSASVNFTGGFFSPKKQDSVSFSGSSAPKKGFWGKFGDNPKVQKFFKSKGFLNFLDKSNNIAWMESLFVLGISTTIKPISLLAVPGAKEEDKKYAATKAFLGGLVDFAIATAFIKPITNKLYDFGEKVKKNPKIITDKVTYLKNEDKMKNFRKILEYAPKFMLVPVRSALTIALIPPTLKYLFPEEAKKLHDKKQRENMGGVKK